MNRLKALFPKDIKRASVLVLSFYFCTFVVGLFIGLVILPYFYSSFYFTRINWIVSITITLLFLIPFSSWYLDSQKIRNKAREGIIFGVFVLVISLILDLLIAIPMIVTNGFLLFLLYYLNIEYLSFIVVVLLTTGFVGRRRANENRSRK